MCKGQGTVYTQPGQGQQVRKVWICDILLTSYGLPVPCGVCCSGPKSREVRGGSGFDIAAPSARRPVSFLASNLLFYVSPLLPLRLAALLCSKLVVCLFNSDSYSCAYLL